MNTCPIKNNVLTFEAREKKATTDHIAHKLGN